jgi:hypothetical protein
MDFINIPLDSLNIDSAGYYRNGHPDIDLMSAGRDRVLALISLPPGTLIMIDEVQPMIVVDGGWLLDGTIYTSIFTLNDRLF